MTPAEELRAAIDQIHSVRKQVGPPQQQTSDDLARDSALAKAEYLVRGVADELEDGESDAVADGGDS